MLWQNILDSLLKFFEDIGDFATWLFEPLHWTRPEIDNTIIETMFGWFLDWLSSINLSITPMSLFTIGGFVFLIGLGLFKLIF